MNHWLLKSEPNDFSISNLEEVRREPWTGVRNYQARNFMRDDFAPGDLCLFYHSNTRPPGVVGLARVVGEPYPDPTQFDPTSPYHDPKSTPEQPRWVLCDVEFVEKFTTPVTLAALRDEPALAELTILQRGNRLSITPVGLPHFQKILEMAGSLHR